MPVYLIVFISIILIEIIIKSFWLPIYYKIGIPLYIKKISSNKMKINLNAEKLKELKISRMIYKDIDEKTIAIRERFIHFSFFNYTPIIHGVIKINELTNEITMIGYVDYYILLLIYFFAFNFINIFHVGFEIVFLGILIIVFFICYLIQISKYNKIYRYIIDNYGYKI